ncbi:hypothetical protein IV71_GL001428 [Fructobacillus fructosus KCTC 3544]|nr:hypothetical protein IV71_GL001428 [Fructobacillus fructosus KCTC 3544]
MLDFLAKHLKRIGVIINGFQSHILNQEIWFFIEGQKLKSL